MTRAGRRRPGLRLTLRLVVAGLVVALPLAACSKTSSLISSSSSPSSPSSTATSTPPTSPKSPPSSSAATSSPTSAAPAPGSVPANLRGFYTQHVRWSPCGGQFRCAGVRVPLNYAHPGGATVTLRLKKLPASSDERRGTLFVNPGGPGGSGQDFVSDFASEAGALLAHYDLVGFDPRGVGKSDPLRCLSAPKLDRLLAYDPDPDTPHEIATTIRLVKQLGHACMQHSGPLAAHVSTIEVAKDLDILRSVVGDSKLTYYGASYGTYIGATYAQLFPHRVGRMVLDGAEDPTMPEATMNLQQAAGFQTALVAYLHYCIGSGVCPLGRSVKAGEARLSAFLRQLDHRPLPSGQAGHPVTEGLAFSGIGLTLYNKSFWPYLTRELTQAFAGDGSVMLALAYSYNSRNPGGGYSDNSSESIAAVNCLDRPDHTTVAQIKRSIPTYERVSPVFGRSFAWTPLECSVWPIKPTQKPLTSYAAHGAPPIIVVGTTRDPATPYAWAKSLARQLSSGVFLSRNGDGHTGFHMGNSCIDTTINAYFDADRVPPNGKRC